MVTAYICLILFTKESEDEGDSGEIDLSPEELQKKTELEQKLKEAKEMILFLEENAEAQSTDETAATNKQVLLYTSLSLLLLLFQLLFGL